MKSYSITTLNDFIILKQKDFSYAKGELSSLLDTYRYGSQDGKQEDQ